MIYVFDNAELYLATDEGPHITLTSVNDNTIGWLKLTPQIAQKLAQQLQTYLETQGQ